jgi:hypothetical protein
MEDHIAFHKLTDNWQSEDDIQIHQGQYSFTHKNPVRENLRGIDEDICIGDRHFNIAWSSLGINSLEEAAWNLKYWRVWHKTFRNKTMLKLHMKLHKGTKESAKNDILFNSNSFRNKPVSTGISRSQNSDQSEWNLSPLNLQRTNNDMQYDDDIYAKTPSQSDKDEPDLIDCVSVSMKLSKILFAWVPPLSVELSFLNTSTFIKSSLTLFYEEDFEK